MPTAAPLSSAAAPDSQVGERLMMVVRDLTVQIHPERGRSLRFGLDSELDRDLGFDSLGRAELISRLGRELSVVLPDELLSTAETVADLMSAVLQAAHREPGRTTLAELSETVTGPAQSVPSDAKTLTAVLAWHVAQHPERPHVVLSDGDADVETISYAQLDARAKSVAAALLDDGLVVGDRVALMLPTGAEFFASFFGILYAGGVPVPIYPPTRIARLEEHLRRQAGILRNCRATAMVTFPRAQAVARVLRAGVPSLRSVRSAAQLLEGPGSPSPVWPRAKDIAMLQYTSGSTGDPKGVTLEHRNLLANIRAMLQAMEVTSKDVFVSWLPLYHDMGLIGSWLSSLYAGAPLVVMSPLAFLVQPARWLWAISKHRGTISAAPNFAYELCLRKVRDADTEGLDLSSWRCALNGAEPVSPATMRGFAARYASKGFDAHALAPVYGLAESAVGLAFPPPGRGLSVERIDREQLGVDGRAEPALETDERAIETVSVGYPLPGHEIRIADEGDHELPERVQGRIQFRGPSATRGFFRNPQKTKSLFHGEWLDSGDLGYIAGGELYVTGRAKDMMIRAGRNVHPQELEELVGDIKGIRKGCVAVFGVPDPASGTERLVVVAETRATDEARRADLRQLVDEVSSSLLGGSPDDVMIVPPHCVRKTSSGKIRRAATRDLYVSGSLGVSGGRAWWQMAKLGIRSVGASMRVQARKVGELAFVVWWWSIGICLALLAWFVVTVVPGRERRWMMGRRLVRAFFRVTALRMRVTGLDELAAGGGILASNHASYLDGALLTAALPHPLTFLAKRELEDNPLTRSLLGRTGALFVERYDPSRAARDAERASRAAKAGQRIVFFPEGTTTRRPGLAGFRIGAFVVAAQNGLPITPVVIRGSRNALRSDQWRPRPGQVDIEIGPALYPSGADFSAAMELRDRTRAWILERCGEPDLATEEHPLVTKMRKQSPRLEGARRDLEPEKRVGGGVG